MNAFVQGNCGHGNVAILENRVNRSSVALWDVLYTSSDVKCLGYFFEPSPNELAALLIDSINLTRIKFGGNRHIYQ